MIDQARRPGKPDTAAQYAYKAIKERILSGTFPPGMPLHAKVLQSTLGISHIPIREALQLLSAQGLVTSAPHKTAVVAERTREVRDEIMLVRALLEIPAVGIAASVLTDESLQRMREAQVEMRRAHRRGDIGAYTAANDRFHRELYAAVGIAQLERIIISLQEATSGYRHQWLSDPRKRAIAIRDHDVFLDALERRDAERVRAIAYTHLLRRWDEVAGDHDGGRASGESWRPWLEMLETLTTMPAKTTERRTQRARRSVKSPG